MNNELVMQKVIERVNNDRRKELFDALNGSELLREQLHYDRVHDTYKHGSKDKTWRKIATIPAEVDAFFCRMYGENYFKDKNFFQKYAPEWLVVDARKL
jgi:hypothetical protein